jgi:predicted RNA-binding protein with PIN domain
VSRATCNKRVPIWYRLVLRMTIGPPDNRPNLRPRVLVDARNVLRSQWPNLAEEELVERCRAWAEREGVAVVLAFDSKALGGLVGERAEGEIVTLVGTGAESADDWLTERAASLAESGREHWLVTSDRELRARAGASAARLIGGGGFLRVLSE